jgi:hypothetical protein
MLPSVVIFVGTLAAIGIAFRAGVAVGYQRARMRNDFTLAHLTALAEQLLQANDFLRGEQDEPDVFRLQ